MQTLGHCSALPHNDVRLGIGSPRRKRISALMQNSTADSASDRARPAALVRDLAPALSRARHPGRGANAKVVSARTLRIGTPMVPKATCKSRWTHYRARMRNALLLLATYGLAACAPAALRGSGYCTPPASAQAFASDPPPDGAPREEHTAALLGLRAILQRGVHEATRVSVLERVSEADLTIAATTAELDCEATRARQAA